jgi:hypothetical protein
MHDIEGALRQIAGALKARGRLLLIEPKGHVSREAWEFELEATGRAGLSVARPLSLRRRWATLLEKR